MKTSEIIELSTQEVQERLESEKDAILRLKLSHVVSPLDDPTQIKKSRRTIARLQTELRQRKHNEI